MKKIISMLLVLLMVAIPLVSCNDPADDSKDTQGADTSSSTGDSQDSSAESEDVLELPEENFGDTFNILTGEVLTYNYTKIDFDEPSDDAYENALYERNLAVEELLGVTITSSEAALGSDVYSLFKTAVDANTGDYDITINNVAYSCTATGAGYCYDLEQFEYIDLDKSWWNDDCTEQMAIGGIPYMAAGDIALSDKECIWAMYFIKDLVDANGLESPYKLVQENKWTWDKMYEMACAATSDENANGVLDSGDIYGFSTHGENWPASWESAGLKLITLDGDGIPQVSWNTEQFVNVHEDIAKIMGDTEHVSPSDVGLITTNLKEGKTLFGTEVIAFVRDYRENDYEFGIVPYPKYNSDVDRYYSYIAVNSCVVTIGNDCADTYYVGVVTEALAGKGASILTPAYYEGQLKSRYSRDEDSSAMLDIIFENRCYDLGVFFNWGSAYSSLSSATASPATLWQQSQKQINKQIQKSLEKLGIY